MFEFTRDGASVGLKAVDFMGKGKIVGPNLCVDRNFRSSNSMFKSCGKIIVKSCIFLWQILIENKVKSYLHVIALSDFS